ncbi:hypothetical protein SYNPS1DRAFT_32058 [Syncephalis pseudoplumigaleata]|uniref:Uncharacterized protein n=1 Tax=Syncephalis pseudoplumigaleata TaxID=1712513 RepID=A0A4P9YU35_9FUNG|nr:hypothetical protein SYNPS1DRAFT_32058 [Syncephalis pseudoplumigaleata]|eukprot:RKP22360.1 hypothetical protein SYNPS1DRAFT_32058 [Syncephalis pseudoplumigaleata]
MALSHDSLSHLRPRENPNDEGDLSPFAIKKYIGWDFEDSEEEEEEEEEEEDEAEDSEEEEDTDEDDDESDESDDLLFEPGHAKMHAVASHASTPHQHRQQHRQQRASRRRRRRRRRRQHEPSAGQRAAAMAGSMIELINEACDLIHWIASVWLVGYYI